MILPKGKVKHQDLMTSYTDVPALLSTLKTEGFSGTIEIRFPEKQGTLFVDSGEVINAEVKTEDSTRTTGPEAVQHLLNLSTQKDGIVNVYEFQPEQVAVLAGSLDCEILYRDLSTDFTRLDRLLLKLKETKHHGFIEVFAKDRRAMGVLFLQDGDPAEMFTVSESGPSLFGRKAISTFVENAAKEGAILNVYRGRGRVSREETPVPQETKGLEELIPILQEMLSKVEAWVNGNFKEARFSGTFRKCLLEKSEPFPFLDPFSGEFEYREGRIRFTGDADSKDLTKGIVTCLGETLSMVEKELPKAKIPPMKLRMEIESILKTHRETIKRLGIENEISGILQMILSANR